MQRILLITRNLPPLVGGMEQLNWHMAEELAKAFEVHVIGPAGSAALAPSGIKVREVPLRPVWKFLLGARHVAHREAREWKPDVVLAGSGLTAPIARSATKICMAQTAVYVHGLDVVVQNLLYRLLWLPALRRADRVFANSHATAGLCRKAGIPATRIGVVHPGVTWPPSHSAPHAAKRFRAEQNLGTRPVLLSVGRLTERKGLREFVAHSLPRIVTVQPEAILLIAGDAPTDALHAQAQTSESIRMVAKQAGVADNVCFLGKMTEDGLAAAYQAADVHVFPVREILGNPEGFGMVATEAAAHGLPTVAFAAGGVVDAVAEGQSGRLVTAGDYTAFADAVLQTLTDKDALRADCLAFARRFAWPVFGAQIAAQLSDLARLPTAVSASP